MSTEALHQLHIFIFVLAVVHLMFCATTMALGIAKMRQWKDWENAIRKEQSTQHNYIKQTTEVYMQNEFTRQNTVGGLSRNSLVIRWILSFLKQFSCSLSKSDYQALRSGFIKRHCNSNPEFNFHKYMLRTLEDDFKKIVGISWYLWAFVVIYLLLNVKGWHTYFWLCFLPLLLLLAVGAKLEYIIMSLAQEAAQNTEDDRDPRQVKPSDQHFWFHRPGIVLYLIHFILFQNSFEIAVFIWIWSTYGFDSCIIEKTAYSIPRLVTGFVVQVMCSYSTLPLYAIVTQMGDMFKQGIFDDQVRLTLHAWAENARRKRKRSGVSGVPTLMKSLYSKGKKKDACNEMQNMSITTAPPDAQIPVAPQGLKSVDQY